ncbi:MAG: MFS transporter [Candidatus Asgardarchaeia archaeon]
MTNDQETNGTVPRFILVSIISLILVFSFNFISPILSLFALSINTTEVELSLIFLVASAVQIILRPFSGRLSDTYGRLKIIPVALFLRGFSEYAFYTAQNSFDFFIARLTLSIAASLYWPSAVSYVADIVRGKKLGATLGTLWTITDGAAIVAPTLGGFFSEIYDYRFLFMINTINIFAGAFSFYILLYIIDRKYLQKNNSQLNEKASNKFSVKDMLYSMKKMFSYSSVRMALLAVLFVSMVLAAMRSFFPILTKGRGLTDTEIGATFSGNSIMKFLTRLPGGALSDKYGKFKFLIFSTSLLGILYIFIPMADQFVEFLLIMALSGIATGVFLPVAQSLILENVPSNERGLAMGLWGSLLNFGRSVGYVLIGFIVFFLSIEWIFIIIGLLNLVGSFLLMIQARRYSKSSEEMTVPTSVIER